jgi:hypothetical protein
MPGENKMLVHVFNNYEAREWCEGINGGKITCLDINCPKIHPGQLVWGGKYFACFDESGNATTLKAVHCPDFRSGNGCDRYNKGSCYKAHFEAGGIATYCVNENCKNRTKCKFAHASSGLVIGAAQICYHWRDGVRRCDYRNTTGCRFAHPIDLIKAQKTGVKFCDLEGDCPGGKTCPHAHLDEKSKAQRKNYVRKMEYINVEQDYAPPSTEMSFEVPLSDALFTSSAGSDWAAEEPIKPTVIAETPENQKVEKVFAPISKRAAKKAKKAAVWNGSNDQLKPEQPKIMARPVDPVIEKIRSIHEKTVQDIKARRDKRIADATRNGDKELAEEEARFRNCESTYIEKQTKLRAEQAKLGEDCLAGYLSAMT